MHFQATPDAPLSYLTQLSTIYPIPLLDHRLFSAIFPDPIFVNLILFAHWPSSTQ